jgi:hypothetical protein
VSLCVVSGTQCVCQPDEGMMCPEVAQLKERIAQLERKVADLRIISNVNGDWNLKYAAALQRAEQSELALAEARRDGYVSVPREPTEAMLEAIMNSPWIVECSTRCVGNEVITTRKEWRDQRYIIDGWQAMLDAALATQPHTTDEAH